MWSNSTAETKRKYEAELRQQNVGQYVWWIHKGLKDKERDNKENKNKQYQIWSQIVEKN